MDSFKRALQNIGRMWANLSATQRVILSAAAAAMVLILVWGSVGTTEAWVRVAGLEIDPSARTAILKKLQERGQKHEVRDGGIFVPKPDADRIVTELAGEGAMDNNTVWRFLEQSDIFATRWDKEMRYQIALQSRLEGMIGSVESVKNAAVVINRGSTSHQLGFVGPKASSSVRLELQEGRTLTRKNVQAIAGLVARAVAGLEEDQVHIMDTKGNAYRAVKPDPHDFIPETFRDHERSIEEDIKGKIKDAPFFAGASVAVRIQANSKSSETEDVKHGRAQPVETKEIRTKKGGTGANPQRIKGEPGAESAIESQTREDELQLEEKNAVDRKQTKEMNPAGEIQRVTVGVLIPVEEGTHLAEAERQLPKLRDFVLRAAGPQARAEDISVQLIPTKPLEPIAAVAAPDRAFEWLSAHAAKIALVALALAGLFLMARAIHSATAKDSVEELQALTAALAENQGAAAEIAVPADGDFGQLKQGLQDMVGRNPKTVAASLRSFMSGR